MHRRALRDAGRLGLALKVNASSLPAGHDEGTLTNRALGQSKVYRNAQMCAEWAIMGRGKPEVIAPALKEMCADLDGTDVGEAPPQNAGIWRPRPACWWWLPPRGSRWRRAERWT